MGSVAGAGKPRFVRALASADLHEGEGRQLVLEGLSLALFRDRGSVFALDGICPHAGSPLGPGLVAAGAVECPWHGWRFRLEDGSCPDVAGLVQTTYPTREEEGFVLVGLPAALPPAG